MRSSLTLTTASALFILVGVVRPVEPPAAVAEPVELRLMAGKTTYAWEAGGMTPAQLRRTLDRLAKQLKRDPALVERLPDPPTVDLTLQVMNRGPEEVTVYVGGDPNEYRFELEGPGVVTLPRPVVFTQELRLPHAVRLGPGQSYDIRIRQLMDGLRGASRAVYWTRPGTYTLRATYRLSDAEGGKGRLLKSAPVTLKVEEPK